MKRQPERPNASKEQEDTPPAPEAGTTEQNVTGGQEKVPAVPVDPPFSAFHFRLATLAQGFLKPGESNPETIRIAMYKAWGSLELAAAFEEGRGYPRRTNIQDEYGHVCWSQDLMKHVTGTWRPPGLRLGRKYTVKGFAEAIEIPRMTVHGYIKELGKADASNAEFKRELESVRAGDPKAKGTFLYDGTGLWDLLLRHPGTRKKLQRLGSVPPDAPKLVRRWILFPVGNVDDKTRSVPADKPPVVTKPKTAKEKK